MVSRDSVDAFFSWMILIRSACHARNLSLGSDISNDRRFSCQPRTVKTSDIDPSTVNLESDNGSSLARGSFLDRALLIKWIASGIALLPRSQLLFISGTMVIPSSMNTSVRPQSSVGIDTSRGAACPMGMSGSKYVGGFSKVACGEWISSGNQSGQ